MRVLFVTCKNEGHFSPNTICVQDICSEMRKMSVQADAFMIQNGSSVPTEKAHYYLFWNKNKWLEKMVGLVSKVLFMPLNDAALAWQLRKRLKAVLSETNYDGVIAVANPVEAAHAASGLKKSFPKTTFILYEIDSASNRYKVPKTLMQKLYIRRSIHWEKKIYNGYDRIIHMEGHRTHYEQPRFAQFANKTEYLDIPCFKIGERFCTEVIIREKPRFLYGGAFYPELRNPKDMLAVLAAVYRKIPFSFDVYTDNRMLSQVKEHAGDIPSIRFYKPLDEKMFTEEIYNSDVLISLGNKQSDFLPSKIFKYMETGKPIIHFYFDKSDSCIPYFAQYRRALLVSLADSTDKNIIKIQRFLSQDASAVLEKSTVENALVKNTPAYTAKRIKDIADYEE